MPEKAYCNTILDIVVERDGIKRRDFEINNFASDLDYEELELLYDLIKTDLVEKVGEDKKIEKSDFQTSQIPPWFRNEELIKVINENFELQTKAIRLLIDEVNKLKEKE